VTRWEIRFSGLSILLCLHGWWW